MPTLGAGPLPADYRDVGGGERVRIGGPAPAADPAGAPASKEGPSWETGRPQVQFECYRCEHPHQH